MLNHPILFPIAWFAIGFIVCGFPFFAMRREYPFAGKYKSDWGFALVLSAFGPVAALCVLLDVPFILEHRPYGWYTFEFKRK